MEPSAVKPSVPTSGNWLTNHLIVSAFYQGTELLNPYVVPLSLTFPRLGTPLYHRVHARSMDFAGSSFAFPY